MLRPHIYAAFVTLLASATTGGELTAQDTCPETKAEAVPRSIEFFGDVKCGSVNVTIAGATFSGPNQGCPLMAVYVPAHEKEVPQTNGNRTRATIWTQVATEIYHYRCQRDYLLFLPWDSTCVLDRRHIGAVLPRMTTTPCAPIAPAAGPTS